MGTNRMSIEALSILYRTAVATGDRVAAEEYLTALIARKVPATMIP
jgi:hypothetical protein